MRHDNQLFLVRALLHQQVQQPDLLLEQLAGFVKLDQSSRVKYHELLHVHNGPQTMGHGDESDIPELATELAVSTHGH